MRVLWLAPLLLVGCGVTPQRAQNLSNWDVCRLSTTPASGRVASEEADRRGLDCRPYYGAIQQQQSNQNQAIQNYLRATQPPPPTPIPTPQQRNCRSVVTGNTVQTQCW